MRLRAAAVLATAGLGLAGSLAGCGATASRQVANPATTTPSDGCPAVTTPTALPADVPTTVPIPAGGRVLSDSTTADGLRVVRFSVPSSLRTGVLFILDRYPKAGFLLARGDAEATEADAPFANQSGTFRGALRLTVSEPCTTTWVLAYAQTAPGRTGPAIPTYRPTSSPTPLAFS